MNTGRFQPQMTQMNADFFPEFFICANLRHLRLTNFPAQETDKALRDILKQLGI